MRRMTSIVIVTLLATLAACSTEPEPTSTAESSDVSEQVCTLFRDLALDAFGEAISESQVRTKLAELGRLAEGAESPKIKAFGVRVGKEQNTKAMIDGTPNEAQDGLANACNRQYPL